MLVFNLEGGTIKPKMNKTSGYENQAGCDELPKSCILHMSARKFHSNVNDTRALIGLCHLMTSHLGQRQIRALWHCQALTIAHIVISLSLHIHSFIHLRLFKTKSDLSTGQPLCSKSC